MKSPLTALAVALVRRWTRVYTWRLPSELRETRRAEIDSDLWEFEHDGAGSRRISPSLHVLLRLIVGIPDDLQWRFEQVVHHERRLRRTIAVSATVFLLAAAWVFNSLQPPEPPPLPARAQLLDVQLLAPPPPPPPPPPPCKPPAWRGCGQ